MAATQVRPEDCLAQTDGEITVDGLDGPLRIVRDRWGIPHIRAGSARDAFFGQGFCVGQDRLFQLELRRQMARGTAAAFLNRGLLRADVSNRRIGFARHSEREWDVQSPEARMILEAYAAGVNAAIAAGPRPYEFHLLEHEMAPWSPVDTLAIMKMVAVGNQWATKLRHAKVGTALGASAVSALVPDVTEGATLITPSGARWTEDSHPFAADIEAAMGAPDGVVAAGGGSNCWVIHGSRTDTGAPIVCGDPHLTVRIPSEWHVMHMTSPAFDVTGPCTPGAPGPLYYGHNTNVAWTMTHANGDRWDVYRERIRQREHGPEALFREHWEPLTRFEEAFEVRDSDTVTETFWETRHGFVVMGDPTKDEEIVAAKWDLFEPGRDFDALLKIHAASSIAEAREGFRTYDSISGNFCFADTRGDIGYQYTGRIPKRPAHLLPIPGWDGEHEWDGSVPKEELPADENPDIGFIITANNRTTTPDYPHYLSFGATPFRADRLRELFDATEVFTLDEMPALQADQTSVMLRELAARFTAFEAIDGDARAMQELLRDWEGSMDADTAAPLVCSRVCDHLAELTVRRYYEAVEGIPPMTPQDRTVLFTQLTSDDATMLGEFASWQPAIERALSDAARRLRADHGDDSSRWRWGDVHHMSWRHNLGRDDELAEVFNLPDVEVGGDATTVFSTSTPAGITGNSGVSFRQIFDMRDLNAARICIPPGNSGQPGSPHYGDHVQRWRDVEYHPLFVDWADIEANADGELRLTPA